jgi:hypothetical protein
MQKTHAIVANNLVYELKIHIGLLKEAGDVNSRGIVSANIDVV